MANIKSQIKRNRQNTHRNERNRGVRSEMKTRAKLAIAAAEAGDVDAANEALIAAQKRYDMAVTKGVIKKNTAARRKSRLTAQVRLILAAALGGTAPACVEFEIARWREQLAVWADDFGEEGDFDEEGEP